MAKGVRSYAGGRAGGFIFEAHSFWEDDVLLQIKPWRDLALFYRYLYHLAEWDHGGSERDRRGDGAPTRVERGQVYMSLQELGEKPGWGKDKVRRELARLEKLGKVIVECRHGATLVTIVDFESSQDSERYRATVARRSKREKCDAQRDAANSTTTSQDSPCLEGVHATLNATLEARKVRRDNAALDPLPSPPFPQEVRESSARARGAEPQAALARLEGEATPCSWWAIANAVRTGFWTGYSDTIRRMLLAEASSAGPPTEEIEPEIRAGLFREAVQLGLSVEMGRQTGREEAYSAHDHEPIAGSDPAAPEEAPGAVPVIPGSDSSRPRARERPPDRVPAGEDGAPPMDSDLAPLGMVCSGPDPP
jgi:hypothetical protein